MQEIKLWRYYDLEKFLCFINGEIYFARADKFKDKHEGSIPKRNFDAFIEWCSYAAKKSEINPIKKLFQKKFEERKKKAAISCWHISDNESVAMWEVYSKARKGIAISTTLSKLERIKKPENYKMEMFNVSYIDFNKEFSDEYFQYELLPFKNKRKEFSFEQEFRIMLYQENPNIKPIEVADFTPNKFPNTLEVIKYGFVSKLNDIPFEGVKLSVDPSEIIDEILASPNMSNKEVNEIQLILNSMNKDENTKYKIRRSKLYDKPDYG